MKTLNENLIEEFEQVVEEYEIQNEKKEKIDKEKLIRIFKHFLKEKKNKENHSKAARKVLNTVLNKEFNK